LGVGGKSFIGMGQKLIIEIQEIFTWAAAQKIWMWWNMLILRLTESFFEPPDDDINTSLGSNSLG
jgi:hypothetical protein